MWIGARAAPAAELPNEPRACAGNAAKPASVNASGPTCRVARSTMGRRPRLFLPARIKTVLL